MRRARQERSRRRRRNVSGGGAVPGALKVHGEDMRQARVHQPVQVGSIIFKNVGMFKVFFLHRTDYSSYEEAGMCLRPFTPPSADMGVHERAELFVKAIKLK